MYLANAQAHGATVVHVFTQFTQILYHRGWRCTALCLLTKSVCLRRSNIREQQPWSQFLGHFTVLLENELCLLTPLPTRHSMLIFNYQDLHQSVNLDLGGMVVSKYK